MGAVLAGALRDHRDTLLAALTPAPQMSQVRELHRARIDAKHLRYLLDAFTSSPAVTLAVLRSIQDDVGELHDAQMLAERLARLDTSKRRPGAPTAAAIAALRRLVDQRIHAAFAAARRSMAEARQPPVLAEVDAMAARCEPSGSAGEVNPSGA